MTLTWQPMISTKYWTFARHPVHAAACKAFLGDSLFVVVAVGAIVMASMSAAVQPVAMASCSCVSDCDPAAFRSSVAEQRRERGGYWGTNGTAVGRCSTTSGGNEWFDDNDFWDWWSVIDDDTVMMMLVLVIVLASSPNSSSMCKTIQ